MTTEEDPSSSRTPSQTLWSQQASKQATTECIGRMMALFCNKKPNCAMFFLRWLGWRVRRPLVKDDIFVGAVEELACNENFVQPMIYHAASAAVPCHAAHSVLVPFLT